MPEHETDVTGREDHAAEATGLQDHAAEAAGLQDHAAEAAGLQDHAARAAMEHHSDREEPRPGAGAERRRLENEFLLAMRRTGAIMQLLGQVSADRMGINATDLNCLNIVALTGHMTAGELARQTGLSTASITGVLDRLEEGGFVRRVRDPHDRRRVIVELGGGPRLREIGPTFGPVVKAWREAATSYSDDELRLLLEFQGTLEEIMRGQLARLRGDAGTPPATG